MQRCGGFTQAEVRKTEWKKKKRIAFILSPVLHLERNSKQFPNSIMILVCTEKPV